MIYMHRSQEPSETIKTYSQDGNKIHVDYIEGSKDYQTEFPDEEIERLNNEILKQIALRKAGYESDGGYNSRYQLVEYLLLTATGAAAIYGDYSAIPFFTILGLLYGYQYYGEVSLKREIKKYDLFMEMYDELDKMKPQKYVKRNDKNEEIELSLATIDAFSYKEIKQIHKERVRNR